MATRLVLVQLLRVQVLPPELVVPSSSGLGRRPLKAVTGVQIPSGLLCKHLIHSCKRHWFP